MCSAFVYFGSRWARLVSSRTRNPNFFSLLLLDQRWEPEILLRRLDHVFQSSRHWFTERKRGSNDEAEERGAFDRLRHAIATVRVIKGSIPGRAAVTNLVTPWD